MHGKGEFFPEVASYETVIKLGFNYWEPTWGRRLEDGTQQTIYHGEIFKYARKSDEVHQIVVIQNRHADRVNWQIGFFVAKSPEEYDETERGEYWSTIQGSLQKIKPDEIEPKMLGYYAEIERELFGSQNQS